MNAAAFTTTARYMIYLLLIFTPLARGGVQDWAITVIHIITVLAVAALLMEKALTWNWKWIKTPLDVPILALIILLCISTYVSQHRPTSIRATALVINYIAIFYLIVHTVRSRDHFKHLLYVIISVGVFLSVFGFVKLAGLNPFSCWDYSKFFGEEARLCSTYVNANHLAGYMEMTIPITLGLLLKGLKPTTRLLLILSVILMAAALILSLSRGGLAGLLFGLFVMGILVFTSRHAINKKIIVGMAVGIGIAILILTGTTPLVERMGAVSELEKTPNLAGRIYVWGGIVDMIGNYPLWGAGPGTFSEMFTQFQPPGIGHRYYYGHNDYLHFISEAGLFLGMIILLTMAVVVKNGINKKSHPSRLFSGVAIGALAGIAAITLHSIGEFNFHMPANAILFSAILYSGCSAGSNILKKRS